VHGGGVGGGEGRLYLHYTERLNSKLGLLFQLYRLAEWTLADLDADIDFRQYQIWHAETLAAYQLWYITDGPGKTIVYEVRKYSGGRGGLTFVFTPCR
jgi:hypothetical protein